MSELTEAQKDKLVEDLRSVIADAEELLRTTAGEAGAGATELRARVQEGLQRAKASLTSLQASAVERARAAGHAADDYVHDNPWKSIGLGASVGLIIGLLIGRR